MSISAMTMAHLHQSCIIKWIRNTIHFVNFVLLFTFISFATAQDSSVKILESKFHGTLGRNATLSCLVEPSDVSVTWMFGNKPVDTNHSNYRIVMENVTGKPDADGNKQMAVRVSLIIHKTKASDHGRWGCVAKKIGDESQVADAVGALLLSIPTRLVEISPSPVKLKPSMSETLVCVYEGFNLTEVKWRKQENNTPVILPYPPERISSTRLNETHIKGTLKMIDVSRKDNGTYLCGATMDNRVSLVNEISLVILEPPQIVVDYIKGVGERKIYFNWTINDGHSPIERYELQIRKNGSEAWAFHSSPIDRTATSILITDLDPNQAYQIKIKAKNEVDWGKPYMDNKWIKTLDKEPIFIPEVTIKGFTVSSMTVGWVQPPPSLADYVHYYELTAQQADSVGDQEAVKKAIHSGQPLYLFDVLTPATLYTFKVRACSELTKECGPWSLPVNATTMDGSSGPVTAPEITCRYENISGVSFVDLSWLPPQKPNGVIKSYTVEMTGIAQYINAEGKKEVNTWGPMIRSTPDYNKQMTFSSVPHNTNFTAKISALTRSRNQGNQTVLHCRTPATAPSRDWLQGFHWDKVQEVDGRWMFKLYLPRVTERNGAICCYKVVLVRMKQDQKLSDMPSPEDLPVTSYRHVHISGKAGAYIADVFSSNNLNSEVILGDGKSSGISDKHSLRQCEQCSTLAEKLKPPKLRAITPEPPSDTTDSAGDNPPGHTTAIPGVTTVQPKQMDASKIGDKSAAVTEKEVEALVEEDEDGDIDENSELKMKTKRQFPKTNTPHAAFHRLVLHDLQNYQNSPPFDSENLIRQSDAGYTEDRKYHLDDDFFINKRIIHQNKRKQQSDDFDSDKFAKKLQKQDDTWTSDDYVRSDVRDIESFDHDDGDFDSFTNNDEEDIEDEIVPSRMREYSTYISDNPHQSVTRNEDSYFGHHMVVTKRSSDKNDKRNNGKYSSLAHKRVVRDAQDSFERRMEESFPEAPPVPGRTEYNERIKKLHELKEREHLLSDKTREPQTVNKDQEKKDEAKLVESAGTLEKVIYDGLLDEDSNYTGFVELLVHTDGSNLTPVYSNYFSVLNPGPDVVPGESVPSSVLILILAVVCFGCVALLFAIALCILRSQNRRNICQGFRGGRHQLVSQTPPDLPPISKQDLLQAYLEREIDSGYKFQHEFERLPDFFNDRTMDVSEARENQNKNRYPDIKAYDQTRVKLSQVEGIPGSDYINANYVMGYKERKKFICAQGPTDVTVGDFWRMIWEQNLELVVMLTNLEECSKVKCAKYWPDQHGSVKVYGGQVQVQQVGEKRYSDYVIRELKISKVSSLELNNSHIIEANGVKKNGEVSNGNGAVSTGTGNTTPEERIVKQYHYLMWKDFVAPEHPHAILKFIKRVNEAAIGGKTILVHCSAGVGRTGTMVALDCLLEQLNSEEQVSVFNTVCDLRRQRNYLVQSLKQYVFIYRALLEYALYSDTEIPVARLKSTVDRLRQIDTCEMEEEFEKVKQPYLDLNKPCINGRAPEHMAKNRSEAVIPYDNNRVILAPLATRENSTYINASFIEGYDNSESYIIAQDPLATTIPDFWRMVSEQGVSTIVMLSELGDGKCPRYWDDEEIQYEHMSIRYVQSESRSYYTKREFQVTNTKNQERINVTQLQYHGWPTVSGQVPEVTRGLIELVGQSGASPPTSPPILVHCSLGTDRSSMFVALCILTTQLRTEQRVDVSTVTRKLRSQRMGCLDTFLQYEFLYRAIVNYAELHDLLPGSS